jgi:hypothetical protein
MKKTIVLSVSIVLVLTIGVAFCYLLYKTWDIFGFWTLVWTFLVEVISISLLGHLFGSRVEKNGLIIYNPKEWPKFLNMLVSIAIGYYLYTIISNPSISSYDYTFGMSYLILLTALPISIAIFKLIRDRNDFISISETNLIYKDNSETGDFKFTDIVKAELVKGIKLTFKDDSVVTIKTSKMNFNAKDLFNVYIDINAKLTPEEAKI